MTSPVSVVERPSRAWPAWAVPVRAGREWLELQLAIEAAAWPPVCREEPETWWASTKSPSEVERVAVAVQACSWCPVRVECRAYAVAAGERDGVWGGTTPADRRAS